MPAAGAEAAAACSTDGAAAVHLAIGGMTCKHCVARIKSALEQVEGVESAEVVLEPGSATVVGTASAAALIEAVEDTGKSASLMPAAGESETVMPGAVSEPMLRVPSRTSVVGGDLEAQLASASASAVLTETFAITGMTCSSCSGRIEGTVGKLTGVESAEVNLLMNSATVRFDAGLVAASDICSAVESVGFGCKLKPGKHASPRSQTASAGTALLSVHGMTCASCSGRVEQVVGNIDGVKSAGVNLLQEQATVEFDPALVTVSQLVDAINSLGFTARDISQQDEEGLLTRMEIDIEGTSCCGTPIGRGLDNCEVCMEKIFNTMQSQSGVLSATISAKEASIVVSLNPRFTGVRILTSTISKLGFIATPKFGPTLDVDLSNEQGEQDDAGIWTRLFAVSLVLTLPVFLITMVFPPLGWFPWLLDPVFVEADVTTHAGHGDMEGMGGMDGGVFSVADLMSWALSTPVQFVVGARFYKQAFAALRHGVATMDVLVCLGTSVAYFYSIYIVLTADAEAHMPFFETSAMLITFLALGRMLEARAKRKTTHAVEALMKLQPDEATLLELDANGHVVAETVVPADELQPGDVVKVVPGSKLPADGFVMEGRSNVDEAMVTGESVPVPKQDGSEVIGGTVNGHGALRVRVTQTGKDTTLARIIKLVQDAQSNKAPVQRFADRISQVFVPAILVIAAIDFIVWYSLVLSDVVPEEWTEKEGDVLFSLLFSISVLVIACPCALGLAVPTAVMVGTGVGASHGILIKGGRALEVGSQVRTVCFDKTGTLTAGKPSVTHTAAFSDGHSEASRERSAWLLRVLAAAENGSEHPLASAVLRHVEEELAKLALETQPQFVAQDFEAIPGRGVACNVSDGDGDDSNTARVLVGNRALLAGAGVTVPDAVESLMQQHEDMGQTVIAMAVDGILSMTVSVADVLKPAAVTAVEALRKQGLQVWMITGDNRRCGLAVARQAGIAADHVLAEVVPGEKSAKIKELQRDGAERVAMVGDGINDAPALAQADIGIAVGCGSDVAIETADAVLVKDNLCDVVVALHLSRVVFNRIRLNFVWALGFNILGIPLAAGLLYPAMQVRLPPEAAGAAMALSSVTVVSSSLLLRRYKPPKYLREPIVREGAPLSVPASSAP
jgi:Cu+-exporting ATPase